MLGAAAVIGAVVDVDLLRDALPETRARPMCSMRWTCSSPAACSGRPAIPGRSSSCTTCSTRSPMPTSRPRRRSLHRRIGELLELRRAGGQAIPPAVLADHFRCGDDPSKCFRYTMETAEAALDAYAFNNAITHLKEALKACPADADAATHFRLWDMLGAAHASSGRLDEAIAAYSEALKHAGDAIARAQTRTTGSARPITTRERRTRRRTTSTWRFENSDTRDPRAHPAGFSISVAGFAVHALPAGVRPPWSGRDHDRRLRSACAAYTSILQVTGMWSVFQYFHGAYRFASFALRTNDPELLHFAYSKFSLNTGMFSLARLSGHYLRRADRAARSCRSPHLVAMARAHVGVAHYFAGRLPEAEAELRAAVTTLDKVGEWFGVFAHHTLRHIHGIHASNASELAEAEWEIATGTARGDQETTAWGQYGKAHAFARMGRSDEAVEPATTAVSSLIARKSWNTVGIGYSTLSFARLQASDYPGARDAAEQARAASFRALCVYEFVGPAFPLLVESLLGPRWAEPERGPGQAVARKAWRESRFARFIGWRYPNYRAHCLRVSGRSAFAIGNTRKAASYFERAIVEAERLGARYDLARAYLDASRVIPEKSEEYRRRGRQLLDELGAVIPEAECEAVVSASPGPGL